MNTPASILIGAVIIAAAIYWEPVGKEPAKPGPLPVKFTASQVEAKLKDHLNRRHPDGKIPLNSEWTVSMEEIQFEDIRFDSIGLGIRIYVKFPKNEWFPEPYSFELLRDRYGVWEGELVSVPVMIKE